MVQYPALSGLVVVLYAMAFAAMSSQFMLRSRETAGRRDNHLEDFFDNVASCCIYCCTLAFVAAEDLLAASALDADGTDCFQDSIDVTWVVDRYGWDLLGACGGAVAAGMLAT